MKAGVAVFVKTPGFSPLKTRLASGIGEERALEFYRLSCAATASVLKGAVRARPDIDVRWSVSEPEARSHAMWQDFPTMGQGEGSLGERLHYVYDALIEEYDAAFLIGADAPQLSRDDLFMARKSLEGGPGFVFGGAADGGFWLFGGNQRIPSGLWTSVAYSVDTTRSELAARLVEIAPVRYIQSFTDVDEVADLGPLRQELGSMAHWTAQQRRLYQWISD